MLTHTNLYQGNTLLVWHDVVAESYPMQTAALRVVVLPTATSTFTIVREGDIAIAQGMVQDGVAMVPLRVTAESLGYTVTWDSATRSIHLSGARNQSGFAIGDDTFTYYGTSEEGMSAAVSAPLHLGAAAYIDAAGTAYVPTAYFQMLGFAPELLDTVLYF